MSKRTSKAILITLFISIGLITLIGLKEVLKEAPNKKKNTNTRALISSNSMSAICKKAKDDLNDLYTDEKEDYTYTSKNLDTAGSAPILSYLTTLDSSSLKNSYIKKLPIFSLVIILIVIILISWVINFYCAISPKFICDFNYDYQGPKKKMKNLFDNIFLISSFTFYSLCVILSCFVFFTSLNINGSTCTMLRIYNESIQGEINNNFIGFSQASQVLTSSNEKINQLNDALSYSSISSSVSNLETIFNEYDEIVQNLLSKNLSSQCQNRIRVPGKSEKLNSNLTYCFDFYDYLFNFTYEYKDKVESIVKTISNFSDLTKELSSKKTDINNELSELNTATVDIIYSFTDGYNSFLNSLEKQQNKINSQFNIFIKIDTIISFIICLGGIILFVSYKQIDNRIRHKYYYFALNIVWNILLLLSITTLILSIIFGIINNISIDGLNSFKHVFNEDNLLYRDPPVLFHKNSSKYINKCVNGDGKITDLVNIPNSNDLLNKLFSYKNKFSTNKLYINNIKSHTSLAEKYINKLDKYLDDFNSTSTDNLNNLINEFNIELNENGKKYIWTHKKGNYVGYKYFNVTNYAYSIKNNSYCLFEDFILLDEYSANLLKSNEYGDLDSVKNDFSLLTSYFYQVNNDLEEYKKNINDIDKDLGVIGNLSLDVYYEYNNLSLPFIGLFDKYVKQGENIFNVLDCSFMKKDVNLYYDQTENKFISVSRRFTSLLICLGIFEALASLVSVFTINYYHRPNLLKDAQASESSSKRPAEK